MTEAEIIKYIREETKHVDQINGNLIDNFRWLSAEIYAGKSPLNYNSAQFIIAKILTSKGGTIDIRNKGFFNVYVVGDFRKSFIPVIKVAEAFATFYSEIGVLPKIIPLPMHILKKDKTLLNKLKYGVLLYERR